MKAKTNIPIQKRKSTLGEFLYTFIIVFILWIGFTTSFEATELIAGVIVSLIIALFKDRIFSCCGLKVLMPHKIIYFIQYFIIFLSALIKSNFDVGKKVAVIGGGNVAIDVARLAARFDSEVTI